jgi:hypothetical protein
MAVILPRRLPERDDVAAEPAGAMVTRVPAAVIIRFG